MSEPEKKFDILARKLRAEGKFLDPVVILREWRQIQVALAVRDVAVPYEVRNLRTRRMREIAETRQGLLFCLGMSQRLGHPIYFAQIEASDFDGAAYWSEGDDVAHFAPIQLKEVPPVELNASATVQGVLDGLAKYTDSADLTIAIYVNRVATVDIDELVVPTTCNASSVWMFAATDETQDEWLLVGDLREAVRPTTVFRYPQ